MRGFEDRVWSTIRRHDMLPRRGVALLAVSGGADSLAMLHALEAICRRHRRNVKLHVAHLNHGIRGAEAASDARFVRRECRRLRVPCAVGAADVPALARERGVGVEEAGREARYEFLARVARRTGAQVVATAHHAGDQVETVLMRVRRGAGPRGLAGIPYVREEGAPGAGVRIVRPLLDVSRDEIEGYLRAKGLVAHIDSTNRSMEYLRNRVRLAALPAMERDWPALRGDVLRMAAGARSLRDASEKLRRQAAPCLTRREGDCMLIDAATARGLPEGLVVDAVESALREADLLRRMLTQRDFAAVLRLVRRQGAASLSGGLVARRVGGEVVVHGGRRERAEEVEIEVSGVGCQVSGVRRASGERPESPRGDWRTALTAGSGVRGPGSGNGNNGPVEGEFQSRNGPRTASAGRGAGRGRERTPVPSPSGSPFFVGEQTPALKRHENRCLTEPGVAQASACGRPAATASHSRARPLWTCRTDTRHPTPSFIHATVSAGSVECLSQRPADGTVEFLDSDRVTFPLRLRPVRPGDRMRPLGMKGSRKISDILTDLRVPAWRKRMAMVVTMQDRPIWLVGYRISDEVKLTPATRRVLRLACRP